MKLDSLRVAVTLTAALTTAVSPLLVSAQTAYEYKKAVPKLVVAAPTTVAVSATALDFSGKAVGMASQQTLTVSNTGAAPARWAATPTLTGSPAFSIASSSCTTSLVPGASCIFVVQFNPTQVAAVSGQLAFTLAGRAVQVELTGSGDGNRLLDISGPTPALTTRQGEAVSGTVTVTNNNAGPLTLGTLSLATASYSYFTFSATNCSGKTLAAGASCTTTVTLNGGTGSPLSAGTVSATVSVPVAGITQTHSVSGTVTERLSALLSGGSQTLAGGDTRQLCYNLHNGSYGGSVSQYRCVSGGGFRYSDSMTSCWTCLVFLDGAMLSSRSLSFGTMTVGTPKTLQVLLENDTASSIKFNAPTLAMSYGPAGSVQLSSSCATLAPGESCLLDVTVTPSTAGTYQGRITLVSDVLGTPQHVAFSGTATYVASNVGTFTVPAVNYGAAPFQLTAPTSDSPGAWSYTSSNTAVATISGSTITVVGGGTTTITATQAASGSYGPTTKTATLTVAAIDATVNAWADFNQTVGDIFVLTPSTSNSTGSWSYSSSDSTAATVNGSTVTAKKAGTYTLTATQAATANYKSSTKTATLTIAKAAPTIGTWATLAATTSSGSFTLSPPTSNSPGTWSYSSADPAVATVSGTTVTIVGVGTTTITATQEATADYLSATAATTLTVTATFASSCKTYLQANPGAPSGWYTLDVDGSGPVASQSYYCDMTSEGGGWTRVVRQTEAAPVTTWAGGVNGASYTLAAALIPAHAQVGFGKDELATDIDYVSMTYQTGDIAAAIVTSPKTGLQYHVYRSATFYYDYHDPEASVARLDTANGNYRNALSLDRVGIRGYNWTFSAYQSVTNRRGFAYKGVLLDPTTETYAWTVWVR